jgi:predicted nucleic acid-binding protein
MKSFVLDSNIIFSSLIKESTTRKIILSDIFNLFAPEFLFTEINKYKKEILNKSGLTEEKFEILLLLIQSHIAVIPIEKFLDFRDESEEVMKDIDKKDSLFMALALKLEIPIWSNDSHFKEQNKIESYTTAEILEKFIETE